VPVGLVGIRLALRHARETPPAPGQRLDLPGQAAAILALGVLAAATIEGGRAGWTQPAVLASYACAFGALAAFVAIQARSAAPMLPLRFFRSRTFSAASA
jgi:DHA2 family methylenomycin A resistance protein-like MFS transporter